MEREIKFRAWDPVDECMFYQDDCYESDEFDFRFTPDGIELLVLDEKWESGSGEWESSEYFRDVENASFMQYTGLKDKNGVEIFEGDVVKFELDDVDYFFLVSMDERGCFVAHDDSNANDFYYLDDFDYLVIGNVHQQPELLK